MFASVGGIALGFALGLRHALEPDHLTAVTTLVLKTERTRSCLWLGAIWGVGHTLSIVALGSALLVSGTVLPARVSALFELGVAVMLMVLGARALCAALHNGDRGPMHRHSHGTDEHAHNGPHAHFHVGGHTIALRPLVVGLVHGLAGSGAMTAFVVAQLPSLEWRILFLILFGIGSIAGMALASGVVGASLERTTAAPTVRRTLAIASGVLSLGLGILWAVPELAQL